MRRTSRTTPPCSTAPRLRPPSTTFSRSVNALPHRSFLLSLLLSGSMLTNWLLCWQQFVDQYNQRFGNALEAELLDLKNSKCVSPSLLHGCPASLLNARALLGRKKKMKKDQAVAGLLADREDLFVHKGTAKGASRPNIACQSHVAAHSAAPRVSHAAWHCLSHLPAC